MKKLVIFIALATLVSFSATAWGQYPAPANRSVIRPVDEVQWADSHSGAMMGGCGCASHGGCSSGICYGYDNCCRPCFPSLICCLKKVGRMLDCLIPCKCCCHDCCLLGHGCGPHLFQNGHCGGCGLGCTSGCPSCSSPIGHPELTDPFQDDVVPAAPKPEPSKDVRRGPVPSSPYAARAASPYKVTTGQVLAKRPAMEAASRRLAPPVNPRDKVANLSNIRAKPVEQSVLRRAGLEEEAAAFAAPSPSESAPAPPALLPVTIQRTSAEVEAADLTIPVNPLRRVR